MKRYLKENSLISRLMVSSANRILIRRAPAFLNHQVIRTKVWPSLSYSSNYHFLSIQTEKISQHDKNTKFSFGYKKIAIILGVILAGGGLLTKPLFAEESEKKEEEILSSENEKKWLIKAAQKGNLSTIERFLKTKERYKKILDDKGNTLLLIAAKNGHAKIVKWLIGNNFAEIEESNQDGMTALLCAVSKGQEEIFDFLTEKGADFSKKDQKGRNIIEIFMSYCLNEKNNYFLNLLEKLMQEKLEKRKEPLSLDKEKRDIANELWNSQLFDLFFKILNKAKEKLFENDYEQALSFIVKERGTAKSRLIPLFWAMPLINYIRDYHLKLLYSLKLKHQNNEDWQSFFSEYPDVYMIFSDVLYTEQSQNQQKDIDLLLKDISEKEKEVTQLNETKEKISNETNKIKKDFHLSLKRERKQNKEKHLKDKKSTVEAFTRILSEKINASLYADKAIYEGVVRPDGNNPTALFDLGNLAIALNGDTKMRVIATLLSIGIKNKVEGALERYRTQKASYIEKFNHHSISRVVWGASKMIAKRFQDQLQDLSGESMDRLAEYFLDKLMKSLHSQYKNKKTENKETPLVRQLFESMIDKTKGNSMPLDLRGKDNNYINSDKIRCWDAKELVRDTTIIIKRSDPNIKKQNDFVLPNSQEEKGNEAKCCEDKLYYLLQSRKKGKYGVCYGDSSDIASYLTPVESVNEFLVTSLFEPIESGNGFLLTPPEPVESVNEFLLIPFEPVKHLKCFVKKNELIKLAQLHNEKIIKITIPKDTIKQDFSIDKTSWFFSTRCTRVTWLLNAVIEGNETKTFKNDFKVTEEISKNSDIITILIKPIDSKRKDLDKPFEDFCSTVLSVFSDESIVGFNKEKYSSSNVNMTPQ